MILQTCYVAYQNDLYVVQFDHNGYIHLVEVHPDNLGLRGQEIDYRDLPPVLQNKIQTKILEHIEP